MIMIHALGPRWQVVQFVDEYESCMPLSHCLLPLAVCLEIIEEYLHPHSL
jgi:hypothetical protein